MEETYEVECIRDHKIVSSKTLYFVKWKGYPESDNTWEKESNLFCDALLAKYWRRREQEAKLHTSSMTEASLRPNSKTGSTPMREIEEPDPQPDPRVKVLSVIPGNPLSFCVAFDGKRQEIRTNDFVRRHYPQELIEFYHDHFRVRK